MAFIKIKWKKKKKLTKMFLEPIKGPLRSNSLDLPLDCGLSMTVNILDLPLYGSLSMTAMNIAQHYAGHCVLVAVLYHSSSP